MLYIRETKTDMFVGANSEPNTGTDSASNDSFWSIGPSLPISSDDKREPAKSVTRTPGRTKAIPRIPLPFESVTPAVSLPLDPTVKPATKRSSAPTSAQAAKQPTKQPTTQATDKPAKATRAKKPRTPCQPRKTAAPPGPHVVEYEETLPDGTILAQFTIPGRPTTKKNSMQKARGGKLLPSKLYLKYKDDSEPHWLAVWKDKGNAPMNFGVEVFFRVWLNNWVRGDSVGYGQAFFDLMQDFGIIADDLWIHWTDKDENGDHPHWFGGIDKANPRVEVTIRRKRDPKEDERQRKEDEEAALDVRRAARAEKLNAKTKAAADKAALSAIEMQDYLK